MADMSSIGGNGIDRPATGVNWNEAARFVNWLNTSQGFHEAYDFATQPGDVAYDANENIKLWSSADAWQQGGENLFRHKDAHYFLPSEDEWYKAAYYNPTIARYYSFATGSNTAPAPVATGTGSMTAIYAQSLIQGPADIMSAGGLSWYGTMAQAGNVFDWIEGGFAEPNDQPGGTRMIRGGYWLSDSGAIGSSTRSFFSAPVNENHNVGFRIAAVPEPSTVCMLFVGGAGLMIRRRCRFVSARD